MGDIAVSDYYTPRHWQVTQRHNLETVRSSIDELVVSATLHSKELRRMIVTAMDGTQQMVKKIGRPIASRGSLFHTAQVRKVRMAGS
jgi:hypothetical protein